MQWTSVAARGADPDAAVSEALGAAAAGLGGRADVVFAFVTRPLALAADTLPARIAAALEPSATVGCVAAGVIGGGREMEGGPAVSLLAGRLPGALAEGFHLRDRDLPDPDDPPAAWHEAIGVSPSDAPAFVVVADPYSSRPSALLDGLDFAYPDAVVIGGLASAATRRGEQTLFAGGRTFDAGISGVALMGDVEVVPAVAQGCRALGPAMRISACEDHLLSALDGAPVLEALQHVIAGATERDRALAESSLLLGFETDPWSGRDDGPWLVRNIVGVDQQSRGLYVGEDLRRGRRVRFHVRDRVTSEEDLAATLGRARAAGGDTATGALVFACLGRGTHLYGDPDHDSRVFQEEMGPVPLGGFFCNGEIGPVGGSTHLHGYTSAFGLFRPRSDDAS